ncbi:MAG: hypothetical protein WCJ37_19995 [Syntrophus sp. (in: bacteria)]
MPHISKTIPGLYIFNRGDLPKRIQLPFHGRPADEVFTWSEDKRCYVSDKDNKFFFQPWLLAKMIWKYEHPCASQGVKQLTFI